MPNRNEATGDYFKDLHTIYKKNPRNVQKSRGESLDGKKTDIQRVY